MASRLTPPDPTGSPVARAESDHAGRVAAGPSQKGELPSALTESQRKFLLSLVTGEPDWQLMKCLHLAHLPVIRWKLQNLAKLKKFNLAKITR